MAWVQWDDNRDTLLSMVRHLPASLEGRDSTYLALLGYRELVVRNPEDFIPRFPALLGNSTFERLEDGRVLQTFPDADFSLDNVRTELTRQMKQAAGQALGASDWYVVRMAETNTPVPDDIAALRKKIREHADWLAQDIASTEARALVEYHWTFPLNNSVEMVDGQPVTILATEPPELPTEPPAPAAEVHTGVGFDPDVTVFDGNTDPNVVEPAPEPPPAPVRPTPPPTTDGYVPVFESDSPDEVFPHLAADGTPLVTVYAPTVEDTGPLPDQN